MLWDWVTWLVNVTRAGLRVQILGTMERGEKDVPKDALCFNCGLDNEFQVWFSLS